MSSYHTLLSQWVDTHKADYSLHTHNPVDQLKRCWEAQSNWAMLSLAQTGLCVCHVQGPPGTAKTATVATLADRLNEAIVGGVVKRWSAPLGFTRILPNTRVPEDMSGFPDKQQLPSGRWVMGKLEDVQLALAEESPHVVLVDELADVHESIQAALLGYLDRRHGQSIFIGCSNPSETATNPTPLRPAFLSRMWNGVWDENPTHWAQRASLFLPDGSEVFPPLPIPIVPDDWYVTRNTWNTLLANFVSAFPRDADLDVSRLGKLAPGKFSNNCPKNTEDQSVPFPCDRTRHLCAAGLAAASSIGANQSTLNEVTEGFIGKQASQAFWVWVDRLQVQSPQFILDNPDLITTPANPMAAHLTLTGCVSLWRSNQSELWEPMMQVLDRFYGFTPDLAQCFFPIVLSSQPDGAKLPRLAGLTEMASVTYATHDAVRKAREAV